MHLNGALAMCPILVLGVFSIAARAPGLFWPVRRCNGVFCLLIVCVSRVGWLLDCFGHSNAITAFVAC